jgi:hypothetical protein
MKKEERILALQEIKKLHFSMFNEVYQAHCQIIRAFLEIEIALLKELDTKEVT